MARHPEIFHGPLKALNVHLVLYIHISIKPGHLGIDQPGGQVIVCLQGNFFGLGIHFNGFLGIVHFFHANAFVEQRPGVFVIFSASPVIIDCYADQGIVA